jgi:hypothetical protein
MLPPFAEWYPCQDQGGFNAPLALIPLIDPPPSNYILRGIFDVILALHGRPNPSELYTIFLNIWSIEFAEITIDGFLLEFAYLPPEVWDDFREYIDDEDPVLHTDCPILRFPGNQGGSWPTLWP